MESRVSKRRMMAVDSRLADMLKDVANKRGLSLYSLINRIIEAYLELEKTGVDDPLEASLDYSLLRSFLSLGFTLSPPDLSSQEAWSTLGQALWSIISSRLGNRDPVHVLARAISLVFGEKNVGVVTAGQLSIIITIPPSSKIPVEGAKAMIEAMVRQATPRREIEARAVSNIVIVNIK